VLVCSPPLDMAQCVAVRIYLTDFQDWALKSPVTLAALTFFADWQDFSSVCFCEVVVSVTPQSSLYYNFIYNLMTCSTLCALCKATYFTVHQQYIQSYLYNMTTEVVGPNLIYTYYSNCYSVVDFKVLFGLTHFLEDINFKKTLVC
jgi:hypothetical protein